MRKNEPIKVLHVDDDPYILDLTSRFLREHDEGLRIESVGNVEEAQQILESTTVECILCDRDALREGLVGTARQHDPQLPILLFTADKSSQLVTEALESGVTDFMHKELDSSQYTFLANRIKNLAEKYRAETRIDEIDRVDLVTGAQPSSSV